MKPLPETRWTRGSRGNEYPDFLFPSFLPLTLLAHPVSKSSQKPEAKGAPITQFIEVSHYKAKQTGGEWFLAGKTVNTLLSMDTNTTLQWYKNHEFSTQSLFQKWFLCNVYSVHIYGKLGNFKKWLLKE